MLPTDLSRLAISAALALALLNSWLPLWAEDAREPFKSVEDLVKHAKPSVVVITTVGREANQQGLGTGFVISKDGLIATNLHVIGEGRPLAVQTHDGRKLQVTEVHASDRQLDLAILRVKADDLAPLELGDSAAAAQGEQIVALGNPRGLKHSVVAGVLSGTRELEGRDMLQLAMPIEPGNSGGPVLDMRGRVLGVVTMKSAITENLGFAVAGNLLKPLLEKPNTVPLDRWLKIGSLDLKQWKPLFGARWQKKGGRIVVSGTGDGFGGRSLCLWQTAPPEPPYETAVWVKLNDEAGAAGLIFCSDGGDKHYGFYPSAGKLRLSRFEGADVFSWNVLGEVANEHYRAGEWNHLKVRVEKDKLQCFVNDHQVFESKDRKFVAGSVGLAKFRDTEAEYRRFEVAPQIAAASLSDEALTAARASIEKLPRLAQLTPEALAGLAGPKSEQGAEVLSRQAKELRERASELERIAGDLRTQNVVRELGLLVKDNADDFDLLRACLLVARLDGEDVDVDEYVRTVDHMAGEVQAQVPEKADEPAKIAVLNKYLFEENGFHGSRTDYYHRANSYLSRVIDDREGLPITLSILYMELAKRLDLKVVGVGLPGHFVVQHLPPEGEPQLIDPFESGKLLSRDDAQKMVREFAERELADSDLTAATDSIILQRVLTNLLGVAQRKADREAMLRYLDAMLAIDASLTPQRGMRAMVRFETGRKAVAVSDLDWLLEKKPEGVDLEKVRELREFFLKP
jgi:S1-C subfamily serine protease/regulator of sirC expression with transglutaminase-like and TPR domain